MELMKSPKKEDQIKGQMMMQAVNQIMEAIIKAIQARGDAAKHAIQGSGLARRLPHVRHRSEHRRCVERKDHAGRRPRAVGRRGRSFCGPRLAVLRAGPVSGCPHHVPGRHRSRRQLLSRPRRPRRGLPGRGRPRRGPLQPATRLPAQFEDPAVCGNLGEACLRQSRQADAIRYLREAAALDTTHTNPFANRARGMLLAIPGQATSADSRR